MEPYDKPWHDYGTPAPVEDNPTHNRIPPKVPGRWVVSDALEPVVAEPKTDGDYLDAALTALGRTDNELSMAQFRVVLDLATKIKKAREAL